MRKRRLQDGKADVSMKNGVGDWTALDGAADRGHGDVVRFLLSEEAGATANVKDKNQKSPLYYAAQNGHLVSFETIQYLSAIFFVF